MSELLHEDKPWGAFDQYTFNEATTVKIIRVEPGNRLSLQRHGKREELWVALDPGLEVEIDGDVSSLEIEERVTIPCGAAHRMSNVSGHDARMLEISFGDFDEDDVERLEDDHGRV